MSDSRQDIMELFSRYLLYIDERKFSIDELAKIFTDDVKITMPSTMSSVKKSKGLRELRDIHATLFLRQFDLTHHVSSDYMFDFRSDEDVNVKCNLSSVYHDANNRKTANFQTSSVDFSAVYINDSWKISALTITAKCFYRLPVV